MPETPETSGGVVEHEIYMVEGIILLVFELKLRFRDKRDQVAQVLLELACESLFFSQENKAIRKQRHMNLTQRRNSNLNPPRLRSLNRLGTVSLLFL